MKLKNMVPQLEIKKWPNWLNTSGKWLSYIESIDTQAKFHSFLLSLGDEKELSLLDFFLIMKKFENDLKDYYNTGKFVEVQQEREDQLLYTCARIFEQIPTYDYQKKQLEECDEVVRGMLEYYDL